MLTQKEAAYQATVVVATKHNLAENIGSKPVKEFLSEHRKEVCVELETMLKNGQVTMHKKKEGEELSSYVGTVVANNWLKDQRLNPGLQRTRVRKTSGQ